VLPSVNFSEKLITRLTDFYVNNMIPEFLPDREELLPETTVDVDTSPSVESEVYCFCQREEFGKIIMGEGSHCPYTWFHFACVG